MSDASFNARLQRISAKGAQEAVTDTRPRPVPQPDRSPRPTGWLVFCLIWFVFSPFGIAIRIARELYMDLTPAAVLYYQLLTFVAITHLLLLGVSVLGALNYRKRQWLFWIAFFTWLGYGVGSALMALKDMG